MADWVVPVNVVESCTATMRLKIRSGCRFLKTQPHASRRGSTLPISSRYLGAILTAADVVMESASRNRAVRESDKPVMRSKLAENEDATSPAAGAYLAYMATTLAPEGASAPVDDVLTAKEASGLLRVNVKTVYEHARNGTIPSIRLGRHFRFSRRAIMARLGECKSTSRREGQ